MPSTSTSAQVNSMRSEFGYISGNRGALYCALSIADKRMQSDAKHTVLIIPPLLEEMNRARRLMACIRHEIARQGSNALLVDLFGTGDSAGNLAEVHWQDWIADLSLVVGQLFSEPNSTVSLIGIRSGCLLLNELFEQELVGEFRNVIHIAPEVSGAKVLQQWLRNSIVKQRLSGNDVANRSVQWQKICDGADLKYAGYTISAPLTSCLMQVQLSEAFPPSKTACRVEFVSQHATDEGSSTDANGWENHFVQSARFWMQEEYLVNIALVRSIALMALR